MTDAGVQKFQVFRLGITRKRAVRNCAEKLNKLILVRKPEPLLGGLLVSFQVQGQGKAGGASELFAAIFEKLLFR
jgi:hypothetical protein